MRRKKSKGNVIGYIAIVAGLIIILSLVLPAGFWWFLFGAALIGVGIYINSRSC